MEAHACGVGKSAQAPESGRAGLLILLYLLKEIYSSLIEQLLRLKCHRTGKRLQGTLVPLYRIRWALSRLWDEALPLLGALYPPTLETISALSAFASFDGFLQNQG